MPELEDTKQERANRRIEAVRQSFESELSQHGHGFHYSVLRKTKELFEEKRSRWAFSVSEFPVQVKGSGTKIDFILRYSYSENYMIEMICECKRSNPASANWCFVGAPFIHRGHQLEKLIFEYVIHSKGIPPPQIMSRQGAFIQDAYHIGLPVRTGVPGNKQPVSNTRQEIEEAATQVMRGFNGYIGTLYSNPQLRVQSDDPTHRWLLPAVFTTAKLYASNADLSTANLETGRLVIKPEEFKEVPWLIYQYTMSPGIQHDLKHIAAGSIEKMLRPEFVRSIAIVSWDGIENYLAAIPEKFEN
jgi:hypothetical protein